MGSGEWENACLKLPKGFGFLGDIRLDRKPIQTDIPKIFRLDFFQKKRASGKNTIEMSFSGLILSNKLQSGKFPQDVDEFGDADNSVVIDVGIQVDIARGYSGDNLDRYQ